MNERRWKEKEKKRKRKKEEEKEGGRRKEDEEKGRRKDFKHQHGACSLAILSEFTVTRECPA